MSRFLKFVALLTGSGACIYGASAFYDYSQKDAEVRTIESRAKSASNALKKLESDIEKENRALTAATNQAESDREKVKVLEGEVASKQKEVNAAQRKLADASDTMGVNIKKASAARKAINDLRAAVTQQGSKAKEFEKEIEIAKLKRQDSAEKWNPLNHPDVKKLLGR